MSQLSEFDFGSPMKSDVKNEKTKFDEKVKTDKIRWGTIIPLIGGSALGCEKSAGCLPEFHLSYTPFSNNEQHLKRYWPEVPFHYLDKNPVTNFQGVDYINSVCPCAGLSMLNTSTAKGSKRGSDSAANKWMLDSSTYVLSKVRPKVLWGENAPGLFTNIGEGVVQKLREIGKQFGYSFSVMKTSTELHGIPQRRIRTFYFFWNTPTVPMLTYQKRERKDLLSYLNEIPKDASQQNMFMAAGKASERFRPYQFVLEREGLTHAEFAKKNGKGTISTYLEDNKLIPECIEWLNMKYPGEAFWNQREGTRTHVEYLQHIVKKRQGGFGYWDDSPRFMDGDSFAAVMKKTMMWAVHPVEDRFLNAREFMHLMGLPHDFEIDDVKNLNHIAQNVPVNTARDMAEQVKMFVRGELKMTEYSFVKQDNMTRSMVYAEKGSISSVSNEEILEMERTGVLNAPEQIQTEEKNIVRQKKAKKMPLTEEELEIRRIEREMDREKFRDIKRAEKEERARKREELRIGTSLSPEEMEQRREQIRKSQEEREAKREERRKEIELRRQESQEEREARREERRKDIENRREARKSEVGPIDIAEITEEMKKFMCYICNIFPRPGSFNRSELYRHYALVHYAENLKKDYKKKYSFPCKCPFCPEDTARMLEGKDIVNHIGQVHQKIEDYLPKEYHLSGVNKRRTMTASIKMEIEETLVKKEEDIGLKTEVPVAKKEVVVKKEKNDDSTNVNRRRSSRLSTAETINYEEDALLKQCEMKGKELKVKKVVKEEKVESETDEEEEIVVKTTRSGRKIKPVLNEHIPAKKTRSGRRIIESDSEEDEIKKTTQTRKKRKSIEMEEILLVEDVKRTRSGRVIRNVLNDSPKYSERTERKTISPKRLSDSFEGEKKNRKKEKVESDSDDSDEEVEVKEEEMKIKDEDFQAVDSGNETSVKTEGEIKSEENVMEEDGPSAIKKDVKNASLDSSLELEELESSLSSIKQSINSRKAILSSVV